MNLGEEDITHMKKSVLAALTAAIVLSMSTMTAFAASPTVGTVEAPAAGQTAATTVEATVSPAVYTSVTTISEGYSEVPVSETTVKSAAVAVQNALLNKLANLGDPALTKAATSSTQKVSATIRTIVDVKPTSAKKNAAGNYEFTLNCSYIGSGKIFVLHYVESAKQWEILVPKAATAGSVTVESATCSPFAVVELNVASAGSTPAQSPKTGETIPAAMMIILIGVAGAAVCGKKVFA